MRRTLGQRRPRPWICALCLGLHSLATIGANSRAGAGSELTGILVRLPDERVSAPAPAPFVELVTAAARLRETPETRLVLVSRNARNRVFAKIILHAFSVHDRFLADAKDVADATQMAGSSISVLGLLSLEETRLLNAAGEEIVALAVPPLERLPGRDSRDDSLTVLVIPGNEPLDETTPTLDTVQRVITAVPYARREPSAVLLVSGGCTVGDVSEAAMMALIAQSRGVPADRILMEPRALGTRANARYAADLLEGRNVRRVFIVSKRSHLQWALPVFREFPVFRRALALTSDVSDEDMIRQMRRYLENRHNARVQARLESLIRGVHGVD